MATSSSGPATIAADSPAHSMRNPSGADDDLRPGRVLSLEGGAGFGWSHRFDEVTLPGEMIFYPPVAV